MQLPENKNKENYEKKEIDENNVILNYSDVLKFMESDSKYPPLSI